MDERERLRRAEEAEARALVELSRQAPDSFRAWLWRVRYVRARLEARRARAAWLATKV